MQSVQKYATQWKRVSGLGLVCRQSHERCACFHSVLQHILLSYRLPDASWYSLDTESSPVQQSFKLCAAHPAVRAHQIWKVCSHMQSAPVWKVSGVTEVPSCSLQWKCWSPKTALLECSSLCLSANNSNTDVYKIMYDFFFLKHNINILGLYSLHLQ